MATDSNIENTKSKPAGQDDASAKLNHDVYKYSPMGGENCGCEGDKGKGRNGGGNRGGDNGGNRGGGRQPECDFKPDYALSTPRARAWQAESEKRRQLPMELNKDCTYDVKWGDSLWTISERELRREGIANPTNTQIRKEINLIAKANDDRYKSLDCNTDFIREGWKLRIPGTPCEEKPPVAPPPERHCPPPVQEQPRPCPPVEQPPPPQEVIPPPWMNRPEPCEPCERPPMRPQPCEPQVICYPYNMPIIRVPQPVCYPVEVPYNCCCRCRPAEPMWGPPQYQENYYYQQSPRVFYPTPDPGYYEPSWPDATYQRPPEPGYRPRPYANYPQQPLLPYNDRVHQRNWGY